MTMALLIVASAAALVAHPPDPAVSAARTFLEAFVSNPQSTKRLSTGDALFVAIDVGGQYADLLKAAGNKKPALAACNLDSLEQTGTPTLAEVKGLPSASFDSPGRFASLKGVYSCSQPGGAKTFVDVNLILKNDLMAMFSIVPRRPNR